MRGTEEQFNSIVKNINEACRAYESGIIKHIQYVDKIDYIFANYSWNKREFYKELNARLGVKIREERRNVKKAGK